MQAMIHKEDSNYQTYNIIYLFSQIEIVKYEQNVLQSVC